MESIFPMNKFHLKPSLSNAKDALEDGRKYTP